MSTPGGFGKQPEQPRTTDEDRTLHVQQRQVVDRQVRREGMQPLEPGLVSQNSVYGVGTLNWN